jgi:cell wall-associated NlpC family hydrolase
MREAEKAKQAKSARRARQVMEKSEARANKKQRELSQPLRVISPGGKLRANQSFRTVLTMVTASGLLATVALPAYAYDPEIAAMARLTTTNAQDIEQDENTQGLTVAAVNTIKFVRGEFASQAAVEVIRQQAISNYLAYNGPSAADYVQNPPYSSISSELVIQVAASYVGTPYIFGGSNPRGFDCSGYIKFVFAQFGLDLVHGVGSQARAGIKISPADAIPGDLVIFNNHGHNGIYAGNGMFYHAPRPGDFVKLAPIFAGGHYFVRLGTN